MKKLLLLFLVLFISNCAFASDKVHVKALNEFDSINPCEEFNVEVIEEAQVDDLQLIKGDIINCVLKKVTDPKRAKQDAKIFLHVIGYQDKIGTHKFLSPLKAKYAKTVINKEEIKKIPPKKIAKKAISTASGFIVKGGSYAVSFVDGFAQNQEDNRFKSGAKQVYDDSFLSLVKYGSEVNINVGDEFYLIITKDKE